MTDTPRAQTVARFARSPVASLGAAAAARACRDDHWNGVLAAIAAEAMRPTSGSRKAVLPPLPIGPILARPR